MAKKKTTPDAAGTSTATFTVIGPRDVFGHPPGSTFTGEDGPREAMLIAGGHLQREGATPAPDETGEPAGDPELEPGLETDLED